MLRCNRRLGRGDKVGDAVAIDYARLRGKSYGVERHATRSARLLLGAIYGRPDAEANHRGSRRRAWGRITTVSRDPSGRR